MNKKTKEIVTCALKPCDTRELIEGVFTSFGVNSLEDKVECMRRNAWGALIFSLQKGRIYLYPLSTSTY